MTCPRCARDRKPFANYYADHGRYSWAPGWWEVGCDVCLPEPDYYLPLKSLLTPDGAADADDHLADKLWYTTSVQRGFFQLILGAIAPAERSTFLARPWPRTEHADDSELQDDGSEGEAENPLLSVFQRLEKGDDAPRETVIAVYDRS